MLVVLNPELVVIDIYASALLKRISTYHASITMILLYADFENKTESEPDAAIEKRPLPASAREELEKVYYDLWATARTEAKQRESQKLKDFHDEIARLNERVESLEAKVDASTERIDRHDARHKAEVAALRKELQAQKTLTAQAEDNLAHTKQELKQSKAKYAELSKLHSAEKETKEKKAKECISLLKQLRGSGSGASTLR